MGSLVRRLRRLDAARKREEAEREREEAELSREALRHLSDEDLHALENALEAGQEDGSAPFEDLYRVSSETSRRAVDAYLESIEALREGREPNVSTEAGEEGMAQSRNGYRIWKYYGK